MKYQVFVDDNFHYMNEDERYLKGEYDTLEEAISVAKAIVDECLEKGKDSFDNADDLHANYRGFGEDPFIMGAGGGVPFSAWKYARERCEEIYANVPSRATTRDENA